MPNSPARDLVRRIDVAGSAAADLAHLLDRQWLITNGRGGYASGTIAGAITWRYHGMLIAALPAPTGRAVMLNHLTECVRIGTSHVVEFSGSKPPEDPEGLKTFVSEFWLQNQMPTWKYQIEDIVLEKRILMPYLQNTVHLTYTLLSQQTNVSIELRPSLNFRPIEADVSLNPELEYEVRARGERFEIDSRTGYPPLRVMMAGQTSAFLSDGGSRREISYEKDAQRGYASKGLLWSPGFFAAPLKPNEPVTMIASTEDWHTMSALDPEEAHATETDRRKRLVRISDAKVREGMAAELVLAADQFIITPAGRIKNAARARAAGDELRSVIAGYHWFTDWGRDTMISLEGLTLTTGRYQEAAWILRTFAQYVRDGLIPNMFPEGRNDGLYHTADATLWFFHAINRYVEMTDDQNTLRELLPILNDIVAHHQTGTHFGIGVDPADGLLKQGEEGYQLTWMDAKVGDWVVTPRRGKAVEINALWYNALRLLEKWMRGVQQGERADSLAQAANQARESFNRRFWNAATGCLFDVIDGPAGDDASIRPNQLLSISLENPVLDQVHWRPVLDVVEKELLTPRGLRSLNRANKDYKPKYFGDLRARDAAYHQGTVWAWLIGPFIDVWIKVRPNERAAARKFVEAFEPHLNEGCIGSISEVFDAEPPFTERGCIAQAWSVAEVLRCLALTAEE
ncbi:MAG TPA: amylo-alpha-1,6-glucosidase [Opitutaceae bacterium]|nr:amylo-alpha-1,6-glucosidase [Opitutaceae bacterium]